MKVPRKLILISEKGGKTFSFARTDQQITSMHCLRLHGIGTEPPFQNPGSATGWWNRSCMCLVYEHFLERI